MTELRIGLIGLGGIIHMHTEQMQKVGGMRVVAVCDQDESKLSAWGQRLQLPAAQQYTSFEALVADPEVDAVISATPNNAHYAIVRACLLHRKPLMTEKPFTRTFSEARLLRELADTSGMSCFVGFSYRYVPSFRMAREWIRAGKIGQVRHVFVQYLQEWGVPLFNIPMNWRWESAITGTGVLHDLGTHMIDAASFLVGRPTQVMGLLQNLIDKRPDGADNQVAVDIDDFAAFTALLEGGIPAVLQTSRNAFGSGNQLEVSVYGDLGTLHMGCEDKEVLTWIHQHEETRARVKEQVTVPDTYKLIQMEDFRCFAEGRLTDATPVLHDGYYNQLALEAVIQSCKTGRAVQLAEIEDNKEAAKA